MKRLFCLGFLLVFGAADRAAAETFDVDYVISDLNYIAARIVREGPLRQIDVYEIATASCSTFRVARREPSTLRILAAFQETPYPADEISALKFEEFVDYELAALSKHGATKESLTLVTQYLQEEPPPPKDIVLDDKALLGSIAFAENVSCDLRNRQVVEVSAAATEQEASLGRAMTKGVIGFAIILLDGKLALDTGGLLGATVGMASGGWGWNRWEEAAKEFDAWWKENP